MLLRFLAIACAAGFGPASAFAQSNPPVPGSQPPAVQPAKPALTPEMRGDIYMARKMYREAIDTFREGPAKDPVLLNKIGIAYHQLTQLDNARKNYEQAIRLKPDYVEALNNLGTVYYARKSYRRAISWYNRALKIAPEQPRAASIYMNLGTAYFARKRYDDANTAYIRAMALDPEVFERHGNYGVMLEERSVEERAKFHFNLAKLYAKGGRNDLALQYLRKALEEGLHEKKKWNEEPEFAGLRDDPEFKKLLTIEPKVL